MAEQLIITLGREFGSGGHEIARRLAERFSLPLLEENMLRHIAEENRLRRQHIACHVRILNSNRREKR